MSHFFQPRVETIRIQSDILKKIPTFKGGRALGPSKDLSNVGHEAHAVPCLCEGAKHYTSPATHIYRQILKTPLSSSPDVATRT
jgi:hypothetical protein